jgi:hypothetical protein
MELTRRVYRKNDPAECGAISAGGCLGVSAVQIRKIPKPGGGSSSVLPQSRVGERCLESVGDVAPRFQQKEKRLHPLRLG